MHYITLGQSDLNVSRICLGSMTWGVQNSEQEAHQQIEQALSQGINFIDTAEMYPIPPSPEKYGETERIIGSWLAQNPQRRSELILASKIAGNGLAWIRSGADISGAAIIQSVDASLQRLQTDYIDLYQLHWPNRASPHFSRHWPGMVRFSALDSEQHSRQMLDILQAIGSCIQAGKIRYFGLSDDTPWGINEYLRLSETHNLPRLVSIQNEFSLLHTKDWPYLLENCVHENIAYLPWSPLGGGVLSGKYLDGVRPQNSRWAATQRNGLFRDTESVNNAVKAYLEVARKYQLSPVQMALAWCAGVDGVTSTIIGATSPEQLQENIDAFNISLADEVLNDINSVLRQYPMPF